eukprot:gi/632977508/ref/XP_007905385.1/ PREDICTED: protein FAM124A [Callorhinchus milii]
MNLFFIHYFLPILGDFPWEEVPDPFLVTMHIIADPGNSGALQNAIDSLLKWINLNLQLFIVSERGLPQKTKPGSGIVIQPALAVILFMQEDYEEDEIFQLHGSFLRPPWQYHHTERVKGRNLPYVPRNQAFFTLADHTALWAVRQVHYGKEIIRFTVYCSFENFVDMVKMYQLILRREVSKRKADFVFFTIYSNLDVDIQFSLKRLPKGQYPTPTESAVLEFRVQDIGHLVALLPNACSPISDVRWQTEDCDGNKLLLQVRAVSRSSWRRSVVPQYSSARSRSFIPSQGSLPQSLGSAPDRYHRQRPIGHKVQQINGFRRCRGNLQGSISIDYQETSSRTASSASENSWAAQRSKSLFSLPTFSTSSSSSSSSSPLGEPAATSHGGSQQIIVPELHSTSQVVVNELEETMETDVDTGLTTSCSDLSVVSAYSTLNGFGKDLDAALPLIRNCSNKPKPGLYRPLSTMNSSLPSYSELSSGSFPQLPEFSSCFLNSHIPSPRAFNSTSGLCTRKKQPLPFQPSRRTQSKNYPAIRQLSLQEEKQEFYI